MSKLATQQPSEQPESPLDVLHAAARQTEAMKADWLGLIKAHHMMLERAFDELIDGGADMARRPALYKRLAHLLTAHSVAEENVIYPALAMCGLQSDSDRLYLDQAHAKVMNAMLDMADDKLGDDWLQRAKELRAAVLVGRSAKLRDHALPTLFARAFTGLDDHHFCNARDRITQRHNLQ
jgi:hypothetical protein